MADLLSRLDLQRLGRLYLLARATKIDPRIVDTAGSDANLFVGSMAFVASAQSAQLAARAGALLLDGAEGEDLDRLALDRYGGPGSPDVARKGAAAALVDLDFARLTPTAGAGNVPINTRVVSKNGVEFVTTEVAAFGASALAVTGVAARAVKAGAAFQVGANTIQRFASVPFDASLTVNNPLGSAGAADRELDGPYRERVRRMFRDSRRAILSAIETGALAVPGVASASAVEELTPAPLPARVVRLYVADDTGVANAVLAAQVAVKLLDYRAAGIAVIITTSLPRLITVELSLTFLGGVDTSALAEQVRAAIFGFVNSLGVNQTLLVADLYSQLARFASSGLIANSSTVVEPVGDLVPLPGETLRVRLEDVIIQ